VVAAVIRRAVERGEIPVPQDPDVIGAVLPSMSMFHLVKTGTAPGRPFFRKVVDRIVLPALSYRLPTEREGTER
jgi:hypothetical protein